MSDYIDLFLEKLHLQFAIVARPVEGLLSRIIAPSAPALFSLPPSLCFTIPLFWGRHFTVSCKLCWAWPGYLATYYEANLCTSDSIGKVAGSRQHTPNIKLTTTTTTTQEQRTKQHRTTQYDRAMEQKRARAESSWLTYLIEQFEGGAGSREGSGAALTTTKLCLNTLHCN